MATQVESTRVADKWKSGWAGVRNFVRSALHISHAKEHKEEGLSRKKPGVIFVDDTHGSPSKAMLASLPSSAHVSNPSERRGSGGWKGYSRERRNSDSCHGLQSFNLQEAGVEGFVGAPQPPIKMGHMFMNLRQRTLGQRSTLKCFCEVNHEGQLHVFHNVPAVNLFVNLRTCHLHEFDGEIRIGPMLVKEAYGLKVFNPVEPGSSEMEKEGVFLVETLKERQEWTAAIEKFQDKTLHVGKKLVFKKDRSGPQPQEGEADDKVLMVPRDHSPARIKSQG